MWCQPSPTPEPSGNSRIATPLTTCSSHRDHDELLISSMQTTVAGSAADNHNKSPSPALLIADFNNTTAKIITPPTDPPSNTRSTLLQQPQLLPLSSNENHIMKEAQTITKTDIEIDTGEQSAAIAQAKAGGMSSPSPPSPGVSVIGIEETASLFSGERWDINRTPTPTFRNLTPPVPHRPPTPPDQIPSIYLEGPMSSRGQELMVREAQIEVEGGDDYDYDEDYEPSGPVILSGKVTLSVISSAAGALSHDEVTDASSLSLDDRAQAEHSKGRSTASGGSRRNVAAQIASVCFVIIKSTLYLW